MNSYLDEIIDQTISTVALEKQKITLQELKSYISDLNNTKGFFNSIKKRHNEGLVSQIKSFSEPRPNKKGF